MSANDGGSAFPSEAKLSAHGGFVFAGGMSLRDYFAIHAPEPSDDDVATQMRLDQARNPHNEPHKPRIREKAEIRSALRYAYADAMLRARHPDQSQSLAGE